MKYIFYNTCVSWDRGDVDTEGGLNNMIEGAIEISRRTFLQHVDRDDLTRVERDLSYSPHWKQGLTMAGDFHIMYYRSKLHGKRVYFFVYSAIEYVFTAD